MAKIKNELQYLKSLELIEELVKVVGSDTSRDDKNFIELDLLSDLVAEYEETHQRAAIPSLEFVIRLRMAEMGLNQKGLAELLDVSPSRISEYLSGKSEPTLKVARLLHEKLKIEPEVILAR